MASCTKTRVMVWVEKDGVDLRLTENEAQAVADVLAAIGGDPKNSRRKYTQGVLNALQEAGIEWESILPKRDFNGSVVFGTPHFPMTP